MNYKFKLLFTLTVTKFYLALTHHFTLISSLYWCLETWNVEINLLQLLAFFWNSSTHYKFFFLSLFILKALVLRLEASNYRRILSTWVILTVVFYVHQSLTPTYSYLQATHYLQVGYVSLNYLLLNTLNSLHPPVLYYSIVSLLLLNPTSHLRWRKVNVTATLLLLTITIYCGAWWASQESNWGGWWNWDPSESFSLFIFLVVMVLLHLKVNFLEIKIANFLSLTSTLGWVIYITLQFSFTETSHSFVNPTNYFIFLVWLIPTLSNLTLNREWGFTRVKHRPLFTLTLLLVYLNVFKVILEGIYLNYFKVNVFFPSFQNQVLFLNAVVVVMVTNFKKWSFIHNLVAFFLLTASLNFWPNVIISDLRVMRVGQPYLQEIWVSWVNYKTMYYVPSFTYLKPQENYSSFFQDGYSFVQQLNPIFTTLDYSLSTSILDYIVVLFIVNLAKLSRNRVSFSY